MENNKRYRIAVIGFFPVDEQGFSDRAYDPTKAYLKSLFKCISKSKHILEIHYFVDHQQIKRYERFRGNMIQIFPRNELTDKIKTNDYDLLYCVDRTYLPALAQFKLPVVSFAHSNITPRAIREYKDYINSENRENVIWICPNKHIQTTFHKIIQDLTEDDFAGIKTVIIPPSISIASKTNQADKKIRKKYKIPPNNFVISYHGRVHFNTKCDLIFLLHVFRKIQAKYKNTTLVVSGSTENSAYIQLLQEFTHQRGIKNSVKFLTNIPEMDKPEIIGLADVMVAPTDNIQETFGLTIIESLSYGIPVIASDWGLNRELIQHDISGFLVPTYWTNLGITLNESDDKRHYFAKLSALAMSLAIDSNQLEETLVQVINDQKKLSSLSAHAHEASKEYAEAAILSKHEQLWNGLKDIPKVKPGKHAEITMVAASVLSHYPTELEIINHETEIRLNNPELKMYDIKKYYYDYYYLATYQEFELDDNIIEYLIDNRKITLKELSNHRIDDITARSTLMWLIKAGICSFSVRSKEFCTNMEPIVYPKTKAKELVSSYDGINKRFIFTALKDNYSIVDEESTLRTKTAKRKEFLTYKEVWFSPKMHILNTKSGEYYVKVFHIVRNNQKDIEKITQLCSDLPNLGIPVVLPVQNKEGNSTTSLNDAAFLTVYQQIEGLEYTGKPNELKESVMLLAKFHKCLAKKGSYQNFATQFSFFKNLIKKLRENNTPEEIVKFVIGCQKRIKDNDDDLTKSFLHGDYTVYNLIYSNDRKVSGIIDVNEMYYGPVLWDLAKFAVSVLKVRFQKDLAGFSNNLKSEIKKILQDYVEANNLKSREVHLFNDFLLMFVLRTIVSRQNLYSSFENQLLAQLIKDHR